MAGVDKRVIAGIRWILKVNFTTKILPLPDEIPVQEFRARKRTYKRPFTSVVGVPHRSSNDPYSMSFVRPLRLTNFSKKQSTVRVFRMLPLTAMTILMRVSSITLFRGQFRSRENPGLVCSLGTLPSSTKNGIRNKVNENQLTATNYGNELWSKKVDKIEISPPAQ